MKTFEKPLSEVTYDALNVLVNKMGAIDTLRFIEKSYSGWGNYTEEKEELFKDYTVDDILNELKKD
jgi:hypothetical protein